MSWLVIYSMYTHKIMMIRSFLVFVSLCTAFVSFAQESSSPSDRLQSLETRESLVENSSFRHLPTVNIGPTVFSGRVTDLDVNPNNPVEMYVAYASGGLWYTDNNGMSFTPLFDRQNVMTIGDIAVDWKSGTIWVGTGEVNSSRSSYAGDGIYKSTDKGETWVHVGLPESHHIGRIILHPSNPDIAYVAALGHLYSSHEERGVFKTTDGGQSWKKILYVDDNTGAVDLIIDPLDPSTLYASMWYRTRRAWDFVESGTTSGIYKSTDSGDTWQRIMNGMPDGEGTGRMGLSASVENDQTIIYSIIDNYGRRSKDSTKKEKGLTKDKLREMKSEQFLLLKKEDVETYLRRFGFPEKYTAASVSTAIKNGEYTPAALVEYLEDANSLLFDTPVVGAEVYRSDNQGAQWTKTHEGYLDNLFNSYGYYFGQIRVEPQNPNVVYIMGVPILRSDDAGKTWKNINGDNVHADHHALWIDPSNPEHVVNGNDGGLNISYDKGEHWIKCNSIPVGQFYTVNVDNATPYNVYGGLQDNGVWKGSSDYKASVRWHNTGDYPYKEIIGGDGMQIQIDARNMDRIYTGYQYGNYYRIEEKAGDFTRITPMHDLGDRPYRWNWQSPILLSSHNQDILYAGCNKLLRSMDRGVHFKEISEDLTKGGKKGDVAYATLTTISESPFQFGLIYTGSDDGVVSRTKDGGSTWQEITGSLPQDMWVSRVVASKYKKERVYVALNGYRWDNFASMVYVSEDFGDTWTRISDALPAEPVNVIKEDPVHEEILYVGTDHGLYISLDRGSSYHMVESLPYVAVHDLVVQEREQDLVIATHGRSIYKMDLESVYEVATRDEDLFVMDPGKRRYGSHWGKGWGVYRAAKDPEHAIMLYASTAGEATLSVKSEQGSLLTERKLDLPKGVSQYIYNLAIDENKVRKYQKELKKSGSNSILKSAETGNTYLCPGNYKIQLKQGKIVSEATLVIE